MLLSESLAIDRLRCTRYSVPTPQSPWKLLNLASSKPVYPASAIPSSGNHNRSSRPCCPLSLCLLMDPGASPCGSTWPVMPFLLGSVSNKVSFQWQASLDLLALPHLHNNKTYIWKQGGDQPGDTQLPSQREEAIMDGGPPAQDSGRHCPKSAPFWECKLSCCPQPHCPLLWIPGSQRQGPQLPPSLGLGAPPQKRGCSRAPRLPRQRETEAQKQAEDVK